jgi:hypothetical protein
LREKARERVTALVLLVILGFYSLTIGWRGVLLVTDSGARPVPVLLGIGVVLVPLVAVAAIWRLVVFARDGSAMMRQQSSGAEAGPEDEAWRAHLVEAETHRLAGERAAEQRAYRAAVRAWRQATAGR